MPPETRFARTTDGTHVAYQVHGDGPIDILVLRAWYSNLDHEWQEPILSGIYRRLGALGRVVRLDRRGTGLSDRVTGSAGRHRGREIDTAGDGFFAAFDGPARAIRCSVTIRAALEEIGLPVRIGLHAGECEGVGTGLRGVAVNIGARLCSLAESGEVLVSSTVRDLVAGSGIAFEDAGSHELKGIPDRWRVFQVASVADAG